MAHPVDEFLSSLTASVDSGRLLSFVMANPRHAAGDLPQKLSGRVLVLRGARHLSMTLRHATRDVTSNLPPQEIDAAVRGWLAPVGGADPAVSASGPSAGFAHARLDDGDQQLDLRISRKGRATLQRARSPSIANGNGHGDDDGVGGDGTPAAGAAASHDRTKQRWLDPSAPWLHALGVTDAQGRVLSTMSRKWKQINKFVEVLDAAWRDSSLSRTAASTAVGAAARPVVGDPPAPLRVMDFGAGKGYLTCAVSAWLNGRGVASEVIGVELRADVVATANAAAATGGAALQGLRFEQGDVMEHATGDLDVMIALHACDTATDHAIHKGIVSGAQLIVCSPCCHKQLRPQMRSPGLLAPMLQHGIHLGQQAEMITDSLRALLLEAHGYRAQVFEFVALEHTSKNKMILAVKRDRPLPSDEASAQIRAIKDFYGVREHCLETLLKSA